MSKSHVLVIAPNWIGDAVMTEPFIRQLHHQGYIIDVLATKWVAPIYECFENVAKTICADFVHGKLQISQRLQLAKGLKQNNYSLCVILPNSWKSLLIPIFAGINTRIAYAGESRQLFLSKVLPNPIQSSRPSMVKHYLALSNLTGEKMKPSDEGMTPQLKISEDSQFIRSEKVSTFLKQYPNFLVFAPGAEFGPAKQWPAIHFSQLANSFFSDYPDSGVLLLGSSKDSEIANTIMNNTDVKHTSRMLNLCGEIPLIEAMRLVNLAKVVISNDSGIMHIAAALQTPQIALFGSSDPQYTPPLSKLATVLYLGLDCSPCHQRKCPLGHLNCLVQLSPKSVLTAIGHLFAQKG